ncbi:tRNA (N6-threonylcarbamoyladenosine(37)-N6)-methyltransferase TrmO [Cytobacillus spongiae]|jgi:tRNA-Thr(GGU) m(6)t(6)A37 methyltransferase TsaA|uniref:tRNA (N6-threonylcarbamoyladenosine(37)-N6)-methyltransferase TrmO n=1 Tax=Cytobacillus spongiae TaxID=2901381 RepID=UPI001F003879|nr:tRNA (N6-threonylcarbamoyladenosine(37)-N6)-methyltransferase TrmO [Cytobacillus spongiae]UII55473.1 tRNA (N6-threonylcarbamoyladenosine(37)-N6)-methyltransferase TrmO [Cytobacillus spongiae]
MNISMSPIGVVRSTRKLKQDDEWGREKASIELDSSVFTEEALYGLDAFSHVIVIFYMHEVNQERIEVGARHPRNNLNWPKVGIFSQRGKNRPNQIGITICPIEQRDGLILKVKNLDAIDGTPVLDIKPYMAEFGPQGEIHQPVWATELMRGYF